MGQRTCRHAKVVFVLSELVVFLALATDPRAVLAQPRGALAQLPDPDGCIVNGPSTDVTGCTNTGKALDAPRDVVVSPDGRHVYVASNFSDAIAVFARDRSTGRLTQLPDPDGCIVNGPSADIAGCTNTARALNAPQRIAVSPDGRHVYVTSSDDAVAVFMRDVVTGQLTQLADPDGCIVNEPSADVTGCTNTGNALDSPFGVAVTPDGKHVYVAAAESLAVAVFARDRVSGRLTQLPDPDGCIVNEPRPDIAGCTNTGKALTTPLAVVVSPNGQHVYVAAGNSNSVAVFARSRATGRLTQLADPDGCIVNEPSADVTGCTNTGKALDFPTRLAMSRDGKHVYVTSLFDFAIAVFARDNASGRLTQLADPDGCIVNEASSDIAGCTNTGKALFEPRGVAVSRDGKHVYVTSNPSFPGPGDAVAVFSRGRVTGQLTQLPDPDGCVVNEPSEDLAGCTNTGRALDGATAVAVSPDGKHVYVVSDPGDAIAVFRRR